MPDYSKSIVYKLCCKDPEITDIYVGSTCSKYKRKNDHKENTIGQNSRKYNYRVYQFIREHGGFDNWDMTPIEVYPCESKTELVIRERYWFEKLGATLNSQYPQRSHEEYRETHKEQKAESDKKYRNKNKEELKAKKKDYRNKNKEELNAKKAKKYTCECGGTWNAGHGKPRHLKTIKHMNWLETGKQKEIKGEQYTCECGTTLTKKSKPKHLKTTKHKTWEQQPEPNLIFVD